MPNPRGVSLAALCIGAALSIAASAAPHGSAYAVDQRWQLGGAGGWDLLAVDSGARRVYVSRADRVMVIDADSGKGCR